MSDNNCINNIIKKYGEDISDKLLWYIDYILEKNEHINLTAVRDRNEAIEKHLIDSLVALEVPEYQNAKKVIDLGTGAGFPGVLLAIASPDKSFVLADSLNKRLKVINEGAETLGITNVSTVHARAEEHRNDPEFKEQFDVCVSRAVSNLENLCKWCLPFIKKNGYLLAYKGENVSRETSDAQKAIAKMGGKVERIQSFEDLPDSISGHNIVVIKKVK